MRSEIPQFAAAVPFKARDSTSLQRCSVNPEMLVVTSETEESTEERSGMEDGKLRHTTFKELHGIVDMATICRLEFPNMLCIL